MTGVYNLMDQEKNTSQKKNINQKKNTERQHQILETCLNLTKMMMTMVFCKIYFSLWVDMPMKLNQSIRCDIFLALNSMFSNRASLSSDNSHQDKQ